MVIGSIKRLSKVARDFNVGISAIVEFLHNNGFAIDTNPNNKITEDAYRLLEKEFKDDASLRKKSELIYLERYQDSKELILQEDQKKQELDFDTENEVFKSAKENKLSFETKNANKTKVNIEEVVQEIDDKELKKLLAQSSHVMITKIKEFNNLDYLVLSGRLIKSAGAGNFGFFEDILDAEGNRVYYPNYGGNLSKLRINKIFIPNPRQLEEGERYFFEGELSKIEERKKQQNPYLLQTTENKVQKAKRLNEIALAYKDKQTALNDLNRKFEEIEEQVENKVKSANEAIENYDKTIVEKFNEIQIKENELSSLKETCKETNNNLLKMENLLTTLSDRISLCRSLQFLSEEDENKYLNILSAKEFKPVNYLDFENDFEKSFSKLSDHIHAYLYKKKNLIYTRYQIRNFLTLLKTHDIIVLSGLSGSGKTQIVKAFAEALGGIAKIIPIKPNWTSSDDLIGYYNPMQMSFLPTPFTEAIVEAIKNPNQLYFICLDEMNLARAEYYFADFLSKLEERSKQPEIELYANHEEELFVSEFSTLLNLIESSIKGKQIKSWQEFLDNADARNKFFEMLGNTEKESMLQLHAKMKRRLIDILKFPSTIRIPDNIRFIGAINVDETTHYFSPKILDRIHVVKFDNPLLFEEQVNTWFKNTEIEKELKPVYVPPNMLSERKSYPAVNEQELLVITNKLKEINHKYLLPLNIDFGIRSIRQSLNYAELNKSTYDYGDVFDISLNTVILQKIFPRFIFDGSEIAKNGETKIKVVEEFQKFLAAEFNEFYYNYESDETDIGKSSSEYLEEMIKQANRNNSQFNFFA